MSNRDPVPVQEVLGIPLAAVRMDDMLALVDTAIAERRRLLIGVVNAAKVVNMHRDPALAAAVLNADVILADGMAVVWASHVLGRPLPQRVTGIDLMEHLLERAGVRGYRVYLLGATDDVLATAARCMLQRYSGLQLVGQRNGYYGPDEEAEVAGAIAEAQPDLLFVAMTSPKKELFLARWAPRMGVPICHGVGGAFDVIAGKVTRAPRIWQALGLEWLYRVCQEPGRLWKRYLVTNTLFCRLVLWERLGRRTARPGVEAW